MKETFFSHMAKGKVVDRSNAPDPIWTVEWDDGNITTHARSEVWALFWYSDDESQVFCEHVPLLTYCAKCDARLKDT